MKRIVPVTAAQAHFEIVACTSVFFEDAADPLAEISLHFEYEPTNPGLPVISTVGEKLFRKRIHAGACLAGPNCANDRDARKKARLGNRKPARISRRA
jgi:hypothetical protein